MEFRGLMGGLYKISEWIMRLSCMNVIWILCSLPFVYLMMFMLLSPEMERDQLNLTLIMAALVAPFTVFPATAAMFAVSRKWVTWGDEVPLLKTFFRGYKENYMQSMVGGFIFVMIACILYVNYEFYSSQENILGSVSLLIAIGFVLFLSMLFHFFSILVHLELGIWQMVKNTILLSIFRPFASLFMVACNVFIIEVSVKFSFMIPFFIGSTIAFVTYWNFHRTYQKIQMMIELKQ